MKKNDHAISKELKWLDQFDKLRVEIARHVLFCHEEIRALHGSFFL